MAHLGKPKRSKLQSCFTKNVESVRNYIAVVDGGKNLQSAIPSKADREEKVDGWIWQDYIDKCIDLVFSRHINAKWIIWVNDPYDEDIASIKFEEREVQFLGNLQMCIQSFTNHFLPTEWSWRFLQKMITRPEFRLWSRTGFSMMRELRGSWCYFL